MPNDFGNFSFKVEQRKKWIKKELPRILSAARKKSQKDVIHGVVFPELSLASPEEFVLAYEAVQTECPLAFLVAGVKERGESESSETRNCVYYATPFAVGSDDSKATRHVICKQNKHHKWCITKTQITDYDISQSLATGITWWEYIDIDERVLNFFAHRQWLIFGFIICEDLARQEPASRLLRAVGPNLVIALLMDGEQVRSRWPARYATVLAEDPGCSVLTLTSRGMAKRAAEVYYKTRKKKPPAAHIIAMWRDPEATHEISMKEGSAAVLLELTKNKIKEYSIDGRESDVVALVLANKNKNVLEIPKPK
jgi:hypothetical protein